MRKRTNVLRRLYQRTKNNNDLRESRMFQYATAKTAYQAARKGKTISWKKHCTATSPTNPSNGIYRISTGKTQQKATMTTLQKQNGTIKADMIETLTVTLEQLILEDRIQDDTDYHREIRSLAEQPIDTPGDKDFTQDEVRQVFEGFKPRKAPGPDGITNEIQLVYKGIPKTITAIYNECLRTECFPTNWKTSRILPITKPGREDITDPSNLRPISLINTAGKVRPRAMEHPIQPILNLRYTKQTKIVAFANYLVLMIEAE